ncbi:hypothetical protein HanIR_Chr14g0712011 [Helianthus annuus]|nr:hypothetical protein HanIR_Chr14g0712011 [Helianthus annuus]
MDTEFYNAFATPSGPAAIAQAMNLENETGTTQKPPKLMSIEEYYGWKGRFENWVQANHLRSWECILKKYVLPRTDLQVLKELSEFTDQERVMYKAEKMMISLLQQAIKEDIFILLQHDKTAKSIWDAHKVKFEGSENMIKSKKVLLKKEFDLFSSLPGEDTKKLIERYCRLVRSMSMLSITKDREEWVDKLADALPQKEWGTYLMILKNTGVYDGLTISQFIEKIESQDLEQEKIARMNSPSGQQDVKMYYKGSIPVPESERSPKIQTAFSTGDSTEKIDQSSTKSSSRFSSFPSVNPKESNTSFQSQGTKTGNGYVIQCNIALNLPEGQNFSEETAKDHMALLGSVLLSYEGLVAGRIGNPMLTKEDYDQIDAKEMELMDIKWCLVSVLRRRKAISNESARTGRLVVLRIRSEKMTTTEKPFISRLVNHKTHRRHMVGRLRIRRACLVDFNWSNYISPDSKACLVDQDDERLPEGFSWDMFVDKKGEFKAFIAKIVREPDMFTTWMKSIGVTVESVEEQSVASDESSESADESSQSSDESHGKTEGKKKEQMEMKTESVAEKSVENEHVKVEEKMKEAEKVVEVVKTIEIEKIVEVVKPCEKCLEACKECAAKADIIAEYEKKKEQLLFNLNYVKESYNVLNKTVTGLQKTNSEREQALTMMNAVMMTKQKAINFYIEESAK